MIALRRLLGRAALARTSLPPIQTAAHCRTGVTIAQASSTFSSKNLKLKVA